MTTCVGVGVNVAVGVGVKVGVKVAVGVGVRVAVGVAVKVGVKVAVGVGVKVGVKVAVMLGIYVVVKVAVKVGVRVGLGVAVTVAVGAVLERKATWVSSALMVAWKSTRVATLKGIEPLAMGMPGTQAASTIKSKPRKADTGFMSICSLLLRENLYLLTLPIRNYHRPAYSLYKYSFSPGWAVSKARPLKKGRGA